MYRQSVSNKPALLRFIIRRPRFRIFDLSDPVSREMARFETKTTIPVGPWAGWAVE